MASSGERIGRVKEKGVRRSSKFVGAETGSDGSKAKSLLEKRAGGTQGGDGESTAGAPSGREHTFDLHCRAGETWRTRTTCSEQPRA
jgi:hypothetical protein